MKGFTRLDSVTVIAYLVGVSVIGALFYKRRSTAKEYFLGGRSMSWLPVGISIIAADLSAITVMGNPAWSYQYNLEIIWQAFGYLLVAPIVILVFVPFYTRLNLYTAYEYLERRFSLSVRLVTSILFQIVRCAHVAIALYAPSLIIAFVTGRPEWQCVLGMGAFTIVYTTLGGMKAVIWTSVIQFCTVVLGTLLISYVAVSHVSGGLATVYRTALDSGRLKLFDFSFDPRDLTSFWACIIGGALLSIAPMTTDQAILQRFFTTKSYEDCKQSIILQAIVTIPIQLLLFFTGIVIFVFYHYHPSHLAGLVSKDAIMPFFAVHELPSGVSGLLIASIFAASMAVMSAGINSLTTASTVDIYQRLFRPNATPEHYGAVGRIGTVCWGAAATLFAMFAKYLGDLVLSYMRVSSFISGPLFGIFALAALSKRTTSNGVLIGAGVGTAAVALMAFRTQWSFFYQGPVGAIVTIAVGYAASLFMAAPPLEKIRGYVVGQGVNPIGKHELTGPLRLKNELTCQP
ncbi:MAG: sodium/solute symporter [Terriglobales bacterium]